MKFIKLALAILSIALFLAACANTTAPVQTTNTAVTTNAATNAAEPTNTPAANTEIPAARELFTKQRCVVCHQENGEGGKNIQYGDTTIDSVPSFKNPKVAQESDSDYIKKIKNGGDGMPKFKDKLDEEQIKSLVSFIRSEFQGRTN